MSHVRGLPPSCGQSSNVLTRHIASAKCEPPACSLIACDCHGQTDRRTDVVLCSFMSYGTLHRCENLQFCTFRTVLHISFTATGGHPAAETSRTSSPHTTRTPRTTARNCVNLNKTEAILFTECRPDAPLLSQFQHTAIPCSPHIRYLGLVLDSILPFTKHLHTVTCKATGSILQLFPLLALD